MENDPKARARATSKKWYAKNRAAILAKKKAQYLSRRLDPAQQPFLEAERAEARLRALQRLEAAQAGHDALLAKRAHDRREAYYREFWDKREREHPEWPNRTEYAKWREETVAFYKEHYPELPDPGDPGYPDTNPDHSSKGLQGANARFEARRKYQREYMRRYRAKQKSKPKPPTIE